MSATLWFAHCGTAEAVKTEYHNLCGQYHPDLRSADERAERIGLMQEINAAYAQASAIYRHEEMRAKAREDSRPELACRTADAAEVDERIRQAIERITTLGGIKIEICGRWCG